MAGTLLLVGATSEIGHAVATRYAEAGWRILLAARDPERAKRNADDLAARHRAEVALLRLDILETEGFAAGLDGLPALPDTVVCAVGELGDQGRAEGDLAHAEQVMRTNFLGPSLLLGLIAERFAARGSGALVGISSVAGDRGRGSNYVYGDSIRMEATATANRVLPTPPDPVSVTRRDRRSRTPTSARSTPTAPRARTSSPTCSATTARTCRCCCRTW